VPADRGTFPRLLHSPSRHHVARDGQATAQNHRTTEPQHTPAHIQTPPTMQSATSKRLLGTLASKLHPQLPLSPRESQQLLTLLTTSFRTHLDREHPTPARGDDAKILNQDRYGQRSASPIRTSSSYASATRHIDSILTNPLFAAKPSRRASEPAAVHVFRDPAGWFMDQIATGAATLPKAAMCLDLLDTATEAASRRHNGKTIAFRLAEWLQSSGLESSREFVASLSSNKGFSGRSMAQLLALLSAQGDTAAPWRWFIRSNEQRIKETKLNASVVLHFRGHLLSRMVSTQGSESVAHGLAVFMQAFRMAEIEGTEAAFTVLRSAGAYLVNRIVRTPDSTTAPDLYHSFLLSTPRWLGNWSPAVQSMLWLHHPRQRSASPGLEFLQSPTGAIAHAQGPKGRRHFLVQLCLGVARQLLEEERYVEAQVAMQFSKEHFADLVLTKAPKSDAQAAQRIKRRKEQVNLDLLDQLAPA
jgi:hypothetical protein